MRHHPSIFLTKSQMQETLLITMAVAMVLLERVRSGAWVQSRCMHNNCLGKETHVAVDIKRNHHHLFSSHRPCNSVDLSVEAGCAIDRLIAFLKNRRLGRSNAEFITLLAVASRRARSIRHCSRRGGGFTFTPAYRRRRGKKFTAA